MERKLATIRRDTTSILPDCARGKSKRNESTSTIRVLLLLALKGQSNTVPEKATGKKVLRNVVSSDARQVETVTLWQYGMVVEYATSGTRCIKALCSQF